MNAFVDPERIVVRFGTYRRSTVIVLLQVVVSGCASESSSSDGSSETDASLAEARASEGGPAGEPGETSDASSRQSADDDAMDGAAHVSQPGSATDDLADAGESNTDPRDGGAADSEPTDAVGDQQDAGGAPQLGEAGVSGSRLKRTYFVAPGGAEAYMGLHDMELGSTCSFVDTGENPDDPVYRCMPQVFAGPAFANAECTERLVYSPVCAVAPGDTVYTYVPPSDDECAGTLPFFTVEGEAQVEQVFNNLSAGECNESNTANGPFYTVSPPDYERYLRADVVTEAVIGEEELGLVFYHASDGTRHFRGLERRSEPCSLVALDGSGQQYCLGGTSWLNRFAYADAECSEAVGVVSTPSCGNFETPDFVLVTESDDDACTPDVIRVLSVDGLVNTSDYFLGDECLPGTLGEAEALVELGDEVTPSELPTITTTEIGRGRVTVRVSTASDGTILPGYQFVDSEFGPCTPVLLSDGIHRCVPPSGLLSYDYFSDPECAETLYHLDIGSCGREAPSFSPYLVEYQQDATRCTTSATVSQLESYAGDVYQASDGCQLLDAIPPEVFIYGRGSEADLDDFVEMQLELR